VERRAIARDGRRAQALEALAFEQERERALVAQLHALVAEEGAARIDELALAGLTPEEAALVRESLGAVDDGPGGDELDDGADAGDVLEDEIRRLQEEIDHCRAAQRALERFVAALEGIG
jgi:hypothetical protein